MSVHVPELRFGNWIMQNSPEGNPAFQRVEGFYSHAKDEYNVPLFTIITGHARQDAELFSDIKLTDEWLITFGFKKNSDNNYIMNWRNYTGDLYTLIVISPENIWNDKRTTDPGRYGIRVQSFTLDSVALGTIEHVHSLQNFAYDIMGRLLKVSGE